MASPRWLSRYSAGQRDLVWHEMRQLGRTVRSEPDLADEAQLVCDEMARRARQNVEVIIERLVADGYQFHANDDQQTAQTPHVPPTEKAVEQAGCLAERFGEVPMTVLAWLRLVGDVWLVGTHPQWRTSASGDPLVVELEGSRHPGRSISDHRDDLDDEWKQAAADSALFVLPVAPDQLHKENTSGGAPYGFVLPDGCVDGLFMGATVTPFVSYLNQAFRRGGFPRSTGSETEWRITHALATDLLPL